MNRTGADWTEFPVEWGARLDLARLQREAERTRPKAITLVHNETSTGTTYPAAEVGKIARSVGALFLLDTVSSIAGIDVRTDEWGVDLNMTGSQKCLAAPLGMALVAVSPRGWEVMEHRSKPARSWAYDLLRWKELWIPESRGGRVKDGAPRRQPVSMPTHLTAAMQVAVRLILEEGLAHRFRRHEVAAAALRSGVQAMGLDMFPHPSLWSNTVSSIKAPTGVETGAVVTRMRDQYGILIGTGLDKIRATTLRIGTMGITASPHYVLPTLGALELTLRALGYNRQPGTGAAAPQQAFAHARFTEGVCAACKNLKMISIWGTGTDNVDLNAAGRHGVTVCNTPGVNARAVAEHALALMLALARRIPQIDHEMREGRWPRELLTQLLGRTLGVF